MGRAGKGKVENARNAEPSVSKGERGSDHSGTYMVPRTSCGYNPVRCRAHCTEYVHENCLVLPPVVLCTPAVPHGYLVGRSNQGRIAIMALHQKLDQREAIADESPRI